MIDRAWNDVPGTGARILPVTRRPNIFCSNTYIIDTGNEALVIDPGAGEEHDAYVAEQVASLEGRRVIVLLTHAHFDHSRNVLTEGRLRALRPMLVAHHFGALAIEGGDQDLVRSRFFGQEFLPTKVDVHLFDSDRGICGTAEVADTGVIAVRTPGHSPDSVCYLLGDVLFTGDLLFSADPGVAGLEGWNRQDLIESADCLGELIDGRGVGTICPGHGRVMGVGRARPMLSSVSRMARMFKGSEELPPEVGGATYVEELMDEIDTLLPAISRGRLLSEGDIDRLMDAFEEMRRGLREEGRFELYHALKARGLMGRAEVAEGSIEHRLLTWIDRLVEGVMVASRGLVQHHFPEPSDIDRLVIEVVRGVEDLAEALGGPLPGDDLPRRRGRGRGDDRGREVRGLDDVPP